MNQCVGGITHRFQIIAISNIYNDFSSLKCILEWWYVTMILLGKKNVQILHLWISRGKDNDNRVILFAFLFYVLLDDL